MKKSKAFLKRSAAMKAGWKTRRLKAQQNTWLGLVEPKAEGAPIPLDPLFPVNDPVNHPKHYNSHPSGVECIDVVEHMPHNIASAVTYCWRCDLKGEPIQDLEKAVWYLQREIAKRKRECV